MDPIGTFRRRAAKRIIRDLPLDLAETELDDPLGLLRGKVRASLDSAQRWERGKAAPARRAWFDWWGRIKALPVPSLRWAIRGALDGFMRLQSEMFQREYGQPLMIVE